MMCEEILQTVRGFCAREGLLEGRRQIALAVSGGADSMALLCLMRPLAEENGITLTVCHVNHGLRGETADRDEAFVREVCARLGLPLRVFHAAELEAEVGRPQAGEELVRELQDHVKQITAPYKYPRIIEFVDELPKTISGKIRRKAIRTDDESR